MTPDVRLSVAALASKVKSVLKYMDAALGAVPERKVVPGPPVVMGPEGLKGLWNLVSLRFTELPQGDTQSELGGVWFKAIGKESGFRSENDWPDVQSALSGRELRGLLTDASVEYEQFTSKPGGPKNRRVVYVRLFDDEKSEIEVVGPHDWKMATIGDIKNYLETYRSGARARRWAIVLSSFAVIFAVLLRGASPGVFGEGGLLLGVAVLAALGTLPVAILVFHYLPLSRLYIDERTKGEPTWYHHLGTIVTAVAAAVIATLIVTFFTGV